MINYLNMIKYFRRYIFLRSKTSGHITQILKLINTKQNIKPLTHSDELEQNIKPLTHSDELKQNIKLLTHSDELEQNIKPLTHSDELKQNIKPLTHSDELESDIIKELLNKYIGYNGYIEDINQQYPHLKNIRRSNFPSEISENLVRMILYNKLNIESTWQTTSGDLSYYDEDICNKIEVKCFSSAGPISFGPNENWEKICFLDAIDYGNNNYTCHMSNLPKSSEIWKNININKTNTFEMVCKSGKRPRINFNKLIKELKNQNYEMDIIFKGNINEILT
jgi:hypothetical protein